MEHGHDSEPLKAQNRPTLFWPGILRNLNQILAPLRRVALFLSRFGPRVSPKPSPVGPVLSRRRMDVGRPLTMMPLKCTMTSPHPRQAPPRPPARLSHAWSRRVALRQEWPAGRGAGQGQDQSTSSVEDKISSEGAGYHKRWPWPGPGAVERFRGAREIVAMIGGDGRRVSRKDCQHPSMHTTGHGLSLEIIN